MLIALSLFAFNGRMALAALWVIPVSAAIVVGSYRVQDKVQAKTMAAKMACADGIQEYIETLRDLKASNAEQRYLSGLSGKIRAVEKQSIAAETGNSAVCVLCEHGAQAGHCIGGTHRRGAAGAGQYRRADPVSVPDGGFPDV